MPPNQNYFKAANGECVASVGKSGSSSFARAILTQHYPALVPVLVGYDSSKSPGWQQWCPKVAKDAVVKPLIPLRCPVKRFLAACAQRRLSVADAIDRFDALRLTHEFQEVSNFITDDCVPFKFPEELDVAVKALGLTSLPTVNAAIDNHPAARVTASEAEVEIIRTLYREDCELYGSP